jgi:hypothetical protein
MRISPGTTVVTCMPGQAQPVSPLTGLRRRTWHSSYANRCGMLTMPPMEVICPIHPRCRAHLRHHGARRIEYTPEHHVQGYRAIFRGCRPGPNLNYSRVIHEDTAPTAFPSWRALSLRAGGIGTHVALRRLKEEGLSTQLAFWRNGTGCALRCLRKANTAASSGCRPGHTLLLSGASYGSGILNNEWSR